MSSFKTRLSRAFHSLLQWLGIESPSSKGKDEVSCEEPSADNEVIVAIGQSQKEIEKTIKEAAGTLQADFRRQINQLRRELELQTSEIKILQQLIAAKNSGSKVPEQPADYQLEEEPSFPIIRYGKLVDSEMPLGFIAANLSESPKGCCFIVKILSGDEAIYRLADNPEMKQEALQMFHPIISTGCEYDNKPVVINDAVNIQDGILHLKDGVWRIYLKNKINLI